MDLEILISGVSTGAFYALVALAYFLFACATKAVNFALGTFVMFAALTSAFVQGSMGLPFPVATLAAAASAVLLAWIAEAGVLRPIMARTKDDLGAVMAIVALMFVIEQVAGIIFTRRPISGKPIVDGLIVVGNSLIDYFSIMTIMVTLIVFACVDFWMRKGRYGRMLRAVGDNEDAAWFLGLPIRRVKGAAVTVTGLVCAVAGVLFISYATVSSQSHIGFAVLGFVAFAIGGTGSAWAPLAGGLIVGVIEAISNYVLGGGARDYVLLGLVLIIFTFWPTGLFHVRVRT